jgi:DedD protein
MKLVLDERVKHRMIGLAVIVSLAAIFAPAIMKKSNQRLDKEIGMHLQLPPKPIIPQVAVVDKEKLFKTIKVAHVQLPSKNEPIQVAKLNNKIPLEAIANDIENNFVAPIPPLEKVKVASLESNKPTVLVVKEPIKSQIKPAVKKTVVVASNQQMYSVQLASFAHRKNAQILVNQLRSKGYYGKITHKQGDQFKVLVGKSNKKEKALKLKNQLAIAIQLRGFIVSEVG